MMVNVAQLAHIMMIGHGRALIQRLMIERTSQMIVMCAIVGRKRTVFKLIQSTPVSGDCTCGYNVKLDREYTVKDFIDTVLSERAGEWGYIGIYDQSDFVGRHFGNPNAEYRYGKLVSYNFPEDILSKEIKSVSASGGWSRMDYVLHI